MSVVTTYHSFLVERADRAWANIVELFTTAQQAKRRIEAIDDLARTNEPTDDEIYNPTLAERKESKRAALQALADERTALFATHPLIDTSFFYHLDTQTAFEDSARRYFVEADLAVGGPSMSDHNEDGTMRSLKVLRLLFPNLGLPRYPNADTVSADQWIAAFHSMASLSFAHLCDRLRAISPAIEQETGEGIQDGDIDWTARFIVDFMTELKPVIADVNHGGRLVMSSDVSDVEDPELLRRADTHIDQLRTVPLFQVPLRSA